MTCCASAAADVATAAFFINCLRDVLSGIPSPISHPSLGEAGDSPASDAFSRKDYNCRMKPCLASAICLLGLIPAAALAQATGAVVLKPSRVFDGELTHENWAVRVKGDRIEAAGPTATIDSTSAKVLDLPGATLMPGLVEGHSHILLHPYNETVWDDQVAREGLALRVARAVNHLRATLMAGFTTIRDLGTEGAGYADVELNQAIQQGIIPGPRMLVSTRAIVATGTYGPKGYVAEWTVPQGAEEADGIDHLSKVV